MELWNKKNLAAPPFVMVPCKKVKEKQIVVLKESMVELQEVCQNFEFRKAAAYIRKFVYKDNSIFWRMEFFKNLKATNRLMARFEGVRVASSIDDFISYLPATDDMESTTHLPARQNLHFILVRMQGAAFLLALIQKSVIRTARGCLQLLNCGHYFAKNALFLSVLGTIHEQAKKMRTSLNRAFSGLLEVQKILKETIKWLPEGYEFPDPLEDWLKKVCPPLEVTIVERELLDSGLQQKAQTPEDEVEEEDPSDFIKLDDVGFAVDREGGPPRGFLSRKFEKQKVKNKR